MRAHTFECVHARILILMWLSVMVLKTRYICSRTMCVRETLMVIKENLYSQPVKPTIQNMTAMSSCDRTNTKTKQKERKEESKTNEYRHETHRNAHRTYTRSTQVSPLYLSLFLSHHSRSLAACVCLYECLFIIYLVWFHTHTHTIYAHSYGCWLHSL